MKRFEKHVTDGYGYTFLVLLAYISGVHSTCSPTGEYADIAVCKANSQTNRTLVLNVTELPQNTTADCRCSVNISQNAKDVQVSFTYQGSFTPCDSGFDFKVSNKSLTCNVTSINVQEMKEIHFTKETTEKIDVCLTIYIDKHLSRNETDSTATITCYEGDIRPMTDKNQTTNYTTPTSAGFNTTRINSSTQAVGASSKGQTSTGGTTVPSGAHTPTPTDGLSSTSTASSTAEAIAQSKFNELIVIAIVAGVGCLLLILVMVAICVSCCRSTQTKATYNVERKQLDSVSSAGTEFTENAFYNLALVSNPNYYQ